MVIVFRVRVRVKIFFGWTIRFVRVRVRFKGIKMGLG